MATVFGISGLRSKLADWRGNLKTRAASLPLLANVEPLHRKFDGTNDDKDLSRVIENLVIPRLIANLDGSSDSSDQPMPTSVQPSATHPTFESADILAFSKLSLQDNPGAMLDFVEAKLGTGCSVETLYVELLAPAARQLGKNWEDDSQDFVDVTMGLWRIQEILRELSARVPPNARPSGQPRSALFSAVPGDQHSFGTLMISDCFERAGWHVDALIEPSQSELNVKCAEQYFDLVGLTVTAHSTSASLRSLVSTIRSISRNPDVCIMLGGRFINENIDLVTASGADATASDAVSAVAMADEITRVKMDAADRFF